MLIMLIMLIMLTLAVFSIFEGIWAVESQAQRCWRSRGDAGDPGDLGYRESGPEDAGDLEIWRYGDPEIRAVERVARRMLEIPGDLSGSGLLRDWPGGCRRSLEMSGDPGCRETGLEDAGDLEIRAVERLARRMLEISGSGPLRDWPGGCWRSRDPEIQAVERVAWRMLEIRRSGPSRDWLGGCWRSGDPGR
ncbi:hypothetical protein CTA1_3147 [Colletotrichum tanaceti]|uniref:Uncharacterized protein n=1 Tax=Colletotrichum tanaceti TaxID=1306861 RepID=A0A4U6XVI5_9PEZI|nr:hypothetical protein CTA1_3147 [Colletotrichum tanaceti]